MATPVRRVPARYFALLLDALQRDGVGSARLLDRAGIEPARLARRGATLLPAEVEALVATARELTGRSDLGFELGRLIKMNSHDILGYGMLSCRDLDEFARLAARHYHLMTETFTLRYRRSGPRGEAVYTPSYNMSADMLRFYCEMLGDVRAAYDFYLSIPEPPHLARFLALAPVRFHFDERALPGVRVVMGADILDRPLPMADPRVVEDVDRHCSALGRPPPIGEAGWTDYLTMMLREARGEFVTLDDLARRLNVSARTIDRHLKKENVRFRELSQRVRVERACELLAAPGATVAQVALSLGFSDARNFSRAFRRVTGASPSDHQRRLRLADAAGA
jgi:AraC-like DNA-binding protein